MGLWGRGALMVLNKPPFLPLVVMRGGFMETDSKAISYHIAK